MGDQDELTRLALHLHVSAPVRTIREVALPDVVASPLLLDQTSQSGGKQKDTGGVHKISAFPEDHTVQDVQADLLTHP
jgi:hypothetical protein